MHGHLQPLKRISGALPVAVFLVPCLELKSGGGWGWKLPSGMGEPHTRLHSLSLSKFMLVRSVLYPLLHDAFKAGP